MLKRFFSETRWLVINSHTSDSITKLQLLSVHTRGPALIFYAAHYYNYDHSS